MASPSVLQRVTQIYAWVCPLTGDIVYVGKTATPLAHRMRCHRGKARRHPKTPAERWLGAQLAQGLRVHVLVVDTCTVADSSKVEREWIAHFGLENLLNVRVGGHGNPGAPRVCWTPERMALLGTMSDAEIAKQIGCGREAVTYRRNLAGIPRAKQKLPANTITLPLDILARLGTQPDYTLAAEIGVSKFVIAKHRRLRGLPSYSEVSGQDGRVKPGIPLKAPQPMPSWAKEKLGKVKDYLLADALGWKVQRVAKCRREAGISPLRARKWERWDLTGRPRKRRSDAGIPKHKRGLSGAPLVPSPRESQV